MAPARTGDQSLIREINLSIILNSLRDHSPLSRASLAQVTGLNKTTVSSLVQQLIRAGFVTESGVGKQSTGRPGILIEFNPAAGYIIGAEIGVDFISVVLTNFAAEIVWRHQERTDRRNRQATLIERAIEIIAIAEEQARCKGAPVLGLALGVPGLADVESGTLLFSPNLRWRDVPLRQTIQSRFDFPVFVGNEATMAAYGESYFGVARGSQNVLYVSAGVGIGGGIVMDGRVVPGSSGFAGEVGHMTVEPDGLPCNCGNRGCWETLASQAAVFRRVREGARHNQADPWARYANGKREQLTFGMIVDAAQRGDRVARQALLETGNYLGIGLASLINALNPEMVVFGGIMTAAHEILFPEIQRVINERAMPWSSRNVRLVVAAHGSDACVMGGIATVYNQILSQPFRSIGARQAA